MDNGVVGELNKRICLIYPSSALALLERPSSLMDRLPESNEDDPVRSALRSGTLPDGCGPPPAAAAAGAVGAELGSAEKVTLGSLG